MPRTVITNEYCAGCTTYIGDVRATAESTLPHPGHMGILLCARCFLEEDALKSRNPTKNALVERMQKYIKTLASLGYS